VTLYGSTAACSSSHNHATSQQLAALTPDVVAAQVRAWVEKTRDCMAWVIGGADHPADRPD